MSILNARLKLEMYWTDILKEFSTYK